MSLTAEKIREHATLLASRFNDGEVKTVTGALANVYGQDAAVAMSALIALQLEGDAREAFLSFIIAQAER